MDVPWVHVLSLAYTWCPWVQRRRTRWDAPGLHPRMGPGLHPRRGRLTRGCPGLNDFSWGANPGFPLPWGENPVPLGVNPVPWAPGLHPREPGLHPRGTGFTPQGRGKPMPQGEGREGASLSISITTWAISISMWTSPCRCRNRSQSRQNLSHTPTGRRICFKSTISKNTNKCFKAF